MEIGRAEGRAEEKISVARNMLLKGRQTVEDIAEYSHLSLDKIKELAAQNSSAAPV